MQQPKWKQFLLRMLPDSVLLSKDGKIIGYGKYFNGTYYGIGPSMDFY